ncbi:MAG: HAD-IA family hydrolase, partial [Pseudomonas sp.]
GCSLQLIERVLGGWARKVGQDPAALIAASHGRRTQDIVSRYCPADLDPQRERAELDAQFAQSLDGVEAIAGAAAFLGSLGDLPWGIVTSAERALTERRLRAVGLPIPRVLVAAEDVLQGKPDPAGYRLGAELLGIPPGQLLVFEDAPAGIAAAQAAGMRVLVVGVHDPSGAGLACISEYAQVAVTVMPGESQRALLALRRTPEQA